MESHRRLLSSRYDPPPLTRFHLAGKHRTRTFMVGVLTLVLSTAACDESLNVQSEIPSAAAADDFAAKFAPIMWLVEGERYLPMATDDFIPQSRLIRVDLVQKTHGWELRHWYYDPAIPEWIRGIPDQEGFGLHTSQLSTLGAPNDSNQWLEHRDEYPGKLAPEETLDSIIAAPVYYATSELDECILIDYWFFFGYSDFDSRITLGRGDHKGDWETVSLLIKNNSVVRAWSQSHGKYRVEEQHGLALDTLEGRPIGYFARNRHGTYWESDTFGVFLKENIRRHVGDVITVPTGEIDRYQERGALSGYRRVPDDVTTSPRGRWDTRQELVRIEDQDWKLWRGKWGPKAVLKADGPTGPVPGVGDRLYDELKARLDGGTEGCTALMAEPMLDR